MTLFANFIRTASFLHTKNLQFMRKLLWLLPALLLVAVSCSKENINRNKVVDLNVSLAADQSYQLTLDQYASSINSVSISKQALNFASSSLSPAGSTYLYSYTPAAKFTGKDNVQITIAAKNEMRPRCGNGAVNNQGESKKTIINIQFSIQ
jgi:hypothetical protein